MIKHSDGVYVFDLDGVITNPENSQVSEEVVGAMYGLLARGTYLAVNTGRSFDWVRQNLIGRLEAYHDGEIFNRFIVVCEKGGEVVRWRNGRADLEPSEFALPKSGYDITRLTFEQNRSRLETMFWDDTKRTMATIEKMPAADLAAFHVEQVVLVRELQTALEGREVRIDPTTIATDVESLAAGKYAGAKLVFQWASSVTGSAKNSFISIGDSSSDYEMARYFAERHAKSTFVYVGKPTDKIKHAKGVTFITTENHYAAGALEFLGGVDT